MSRRSEVVAAVAKPSFSSGLAIMGGIILISLTMRAPLTSVGPLVGWIRESTGLSATAVGLLTTLPLLAFALLSPFAPLLARRFGLERVVLYALVLLMAGIGIRSITDAVPLFAGTVLLGLAIAVCNVLLPGLVKREFSHRIGIVTGIYSVSMNLCGAIASGVSVPIARDLGFGWSGALGFWGVFALLAALFWLPHARAERLPAAASVSGAPERRSLWRSPLAWQVTLFMGMQSLIFYVTVAWFPEIMTSRGMSADNAGWMLSLMQFALLPVTFIVPIVAGRMKNQRVLVIVTAVLYGGALCGFFFGNSALTPLWTILLGIAGGIAFSLAMIFFSLRTNNAHDAAALSGMAQSVGYLLAAAGPTLFGLLHDATAAWQLPAVLLLASSVLLFVCGLGAGNNRTV